MPQVPYRHVTLDPAFLEAVRHEQDADAWMRQLLDAGFILPLEEIHLKDGSPLEGILAVRTVLEQLRQAEAALRQASHPLPWLVGGVPNAVWIGLGGGFLALVAIWNIIVALLIGVAVLGVLGLAGLLVTLLSMKKRGELVRLRQRELDQARLALRDLVEAAFHRSYLARSGRVLVECLPHLRWLNHRINRVHGVLREPTTNQPLRDLLISMVETRKRIEARRDAWLKDPEPEWIREDLEFSVAELDQKLQETRVPVGATDKVLEGVMRRGARLGGEPAPGT